jgi:hypothetical protein
MLEWSHFSALCHTFLHCVTLFCTVSHFSALCHCDPVCSHTYTTLAAVPIADPIILTANHTVSHCLLLWSLHPTNSTYTTCTHYTCYMYCTCPYVTHHTQRCRCSCGSCACKYSMLLHLQRCLVCYQLHYYMPYDAEAVWSLVQPHSGHLSQGSAHWNFYIAPEYEIMLVLSFPLLARRADLDYI